MTPLTARPVVDLEVKRVVEKATAEVRVARRLIPYRSIEMVIIGSEDIVVMKGLSLG